MIIAVIPAKTPMLMATMAPIFSFFCILRGQMSFHGKSARRMSIKAEYPVISSVTSTPGRSTQRTETYQSKA